MVGGGAEPLLERAFAVTGDELSAGTDAVPCVEAFTTYYRADPATETTIFEGVVPALEALAERGLRLGICTNKPHQSALQVLEALSLDGHFAACLGKASVPFHKPEPASLRRSRARAWCVTA